MKFQSSGENSSLSEINIIPLVDIMLVLLIIFMVTAPMLSQGIEVNLPEVQAANVNVKEEDVILSIDGNGQIYIGDNKDDKFTMLNVETRLMETYKDKKDKVLYLKADEAIQYGYVMEVMAAARRAGVEKLGMITESQDEKEMEKSNTKKVSLR